MWITKESIFCTHENNCTYEITAVLAACTSPQKALNRRISTCRREVDKSCLPRWGLNGHWKPQWMTGWSVFFKSVAFYMGTMLQWTVIHSRVQIDVMGCCYEMKTQSWMDVEEGIDLRGVMGGGMNMIKIYYMKS